MPSSNNFDQSFNYQGVYPCPVCRLGEMESLPMMEALSCQVCQHFFTANLEKQQLVMVDRDPPLIWQWNGKNWVGAHLQGVELGWGYSVAAIAFTVLPPLLIGFANYLFPPVPGSRLSWLPNAWALLALLTHLAIIGWLVLEFYQFPLRTYFRVRRQQLFGR